MIEYKPPQDWLLYNKAALIDDLIAAKAAVQSLKTLPYQREWVDKLQEVQLKMEVAGTSRIEGAVFEDTQLELAMAETPEELFTTHSQKQAHAAKNTYQWIASLEDAQPIDANLIRDIHRRIVTGADDDHCPPGQIRGKDDNVTFGFPPHRGAQGGEQCNAMFANLVRVAQNEFIDHDPLIRALALHYHFAAIHPFLDGNGRTARALEALLLQRVGLRDSAFIAMSNYYYDEKGKYLSILAKVRSDEHNLTPFLIFGLQGVAIQCKKLFAEINKHILKALFKNTMRNLFERLKTKRKRVVAGRQVEISNIILDREEIELDELFTATKPFYSSLKNQNIAFVRDINNLEYLGAIQIVKNENDEIIISVRLKWPAEISETDFMKKIKEFPVAKSQSFLK